MNDIGIIAGIAGFFLLLGVMIPFIQTGFDQTVTTNNVDAFEDSVGQGVEDSQDLSGLSVLTGDVPSIFQVIKSALLMFFWTFGAVPFWMDTIFLILRFTFWITLARNVWIGGGS